MIKSKLELDGLKQRLILIILESTLVVLGVLLGYYVDQWRINQANQQEAETALFAIQAEFESNYQQVKKLLPSHKQMEGSLDLLSNGITNGTLTYV